MTPESATWERAAVVRAAAEAWHRAGAIDDATADRIRTATPDPCETPAAVWRVLTAGVVSAVVLCLLGAFAAALWRSVAVLRGVLFVFAGTSVAAT